MRSNSLAVDIAIDAPVQKVWSAIADWQGQGKWMLQTSVFLTSEKSEGLDVTIEAFTGPLHRLYPRMKFLGVLDLMKVTRWEPPFRCDVLHYGKIIKGTGTFIIEPINENRSIFHWSEEILAPLPLFLILKPFILLGVKFSLARFRTMLE